MGPEHWIPVEPNLAASVGWAVRPLPALIAEPVEETPEAVDEVAEPPQPPAPRPARGPVPVEREAVPVRMPRRRRFPRLLAASIVVILVAGGLGAGVTVLLWPKAGLSKGGEQSPRRPTPETAPSQKAASEQPRRNPVVVAAGDIACDPLASTFNDGFGTSKRCHQGYTAEVVQKLEPDAVLVLGDAQYEDARYWKYTKSYDVSWGRFKQISYPTPAGSHDRFGHGGYRRYWGVRAGPQGSDWYSFDVGDWHIVSLNSNCRGSAGCDAGSAQEQWLRADLAAHRTRCALAYWHEPRFSSSKAAPFRMRPIWQALSDFGAELVLSGDAHNYERFRPQDAAGHVDRRRGIRQFVVGTGGKSLVPIKRPSRGSVIRNDTTFGVLKLTLRPKSYEWQFVPEPGGSFSDAGSASCH